MGRFSTLLPAFAFLPWLWAPLQTAAQVGTDEVVTWRSYSAERSAHVRIFPSGSESRPFTVVIEEVETSGAPVTDEARYVAETIGRTFGFDPVEAYFVFRYAAGPPAGTTVSDKILLLRATFRRGTSGALGAPSWRVISGEALNDLTDRAF